MKTKPPQKQPALAFASRFVSTDECRHTLRHVWSEYYDDQWWLAGSDGHVAGLSRYCDTIERKPGLVLRGFETLEAPGCNNVARLCLAPSNPAPLLAACWNDAIPFLRKLLGKPRRLKHLNASIVFLRTDDQWSWDLNPTKQAIASADLRIYMDAGYVLFTGVATEIRIPVGMADKCVEPVQVWVSEHQLVAIMPRRER